MRVQVNLSDEIVNDLDKLAKRYGVSRSALCSTLIGQGISSHMEAYEICSNPELLASILAANKFFDKPE